MSIFALIGNFFKNKIFSHFTSKVAIWVVTAMCVAALLLQYFVRPDAVSVVTIVGAVIVPFQEGVNEVGGFLFRTEDTRKKNKEKDAYINELEMENEELKRELEANAYMAEENVSLRLLLSAKERITDYEMVEADVIGTDGINCFTRFTINKGALSGIKNGMNVIDSKGLIGIITEVGPNYAIVTSIIEDGMNVAAMTKNGRENCMIKGEVDLQKDGMMRLSDALLTVDLTEDKTLVTSSISDRFLPNLKIGYAKDIVANDDGLTQSGYVTTAVDFRNIRHVLVITTTVEEQKGLVGGEENE